ncbi:MAG: MFS transporter [Candidatus Eisenbacteria bacterium]|uniref:MFS transporter n=1 Tax=Eiseniibacteriota bacterium TaxID=2212470 RepID=A0A849SVH1_UNCEI|nr:MFS transporter [Candidatus Eisenbacteria bacterium]
MAFLRATGTGMVGVVAGLYLARVGLGGAALGNVLASGLAGIAIALTVVTLASDRVGRRRTLVALGILTAAGTLAFAWASGPWLLAGTAFIGMINGMGRDRGAQLVLEQAIIPATTSDHERTSVFARYNVAQDLGHALGALLSAAPALWFGGDPVASIASLRTVLVMHAVLSLVCAAFALALSSQAEAEGAPRLHISPETRPRLIRWSALSFVDSLGGGFLTTAALSLIFATRFGASESQLGPLFFGARVLNALSHFGAAWLSRRIGLLNTMVFTHIPSSLLLASVSIAPNFLVASILFLLREGLVEMDVPTRQSYVMAIVRPDERTTAAGITALVRTTAWAIGPAAAGLLLGGASSSAALAVGAGLKISYDLMLWGAFRRVKPPEELAPKP